MSSFKYKKESSFGAVTTGDVYQVVASSSSEIKPRVEPVSSEGFKEGQKGVQARRRKMLAKGGEGSLNFDVVEGGILPLLDTAFDSSSTALVSGATDTYEHEFALTGAQPQNSVALQTIKDLEDGTSEIETYRGGQITEISMSGDAKLLNMEMSFRTTGYSSSTADFGAPENGEEALFNYRTDIMLQKIVWNKDTKTWDDVDAPFKACPISWDWTVNIGLSESEDRVCAEGASRLIKRNLYQGSGSLTDLILDTDTIKIKEGYLATETFRVSYTTTSSEIETGYSNEIVSEFALQFDDSVTSVEIGGFAVINGSFTMVDVGDAEFMKLTVQSEEDSI